MTELTFTVIPGHAKGMSPEPTTGCIEMDSGLAPSARPGMT